MDSSQVGVLEEANQVSLRRLLESEDGRSLESQVSLEVLGDLTDKSLEGELADEELSRLLVSADLSESDSSGSVSVGLLDSAGGGGGLAGSLGGELLSGGLASSGLSCGLLGTGHFKLVSSLVKLCNLIIDIIRVTQTIFEHFKNKNTLGPKLATQHQNLFYVFERWPRGRKLKWNTVPSVTFRIRKLIFDVGLLVVFCRGCSYS